MTPKVDRFRAKGGGQIMADRDKAASRGCGSWSGQRLSFVSSTASWSRQGSITPPCNFHCSLMDGSLVEPQRISQNIAMQAISWRDDQKLP